MPDVTIDYADWTPKSAASVDQNVATRRSNINWFVHVTHVKGVQTQITASVQMFLPVTYDEPSRSWGTAVARSAPIESGGGGGLIGPIAITLSGKCGRTPCRIIAYPGAQVAAGAPEEAAGALLDTFVQVVM